MHNNKIQTDPTAHCLNTNGWVKRLRFCGDTATLTEARLDMLILSHLIFRPLALRSHLVTVGKTKVQNCAGVSRGKRCLDATK